MVAREDENIADTIEAGVNLNNEAHILPHELTFRGKVDPSRETFVEGEKREAEQEAALSDLKSALIGLNQPRR